MALTGSTTPSSTKRKRILRQTQSVPEVHEQGVELPNKQRHSGKRTNGIRWNTNKCPKCNVSGGIVPIIYGNVNEETQMEANEAAKDNDYFYCQSCGTYFDHKGSVMVGPNSRPSTNPSNGFASNQTSRLGHQTNMPKQTSSRSNSSSKSKDHSNINKPFSNQMTSTNSGGPTSTNRSSSRSKNSSGNGSTRCGNLRIFLSYRFYVKSILVILKPQKLPF